MRPRILQKSGLHAKNMPFCTNIAKRVLEAYVQGTSFKAYLDTNCYIRIYKIWNFSTRHEKVVKLLTCHSFKS